MFVLNPDPYSLPCYRIGPFQTKDISLNHSLPDSNLVDDYFNKRFSGKEYLYTYNGRMAINLALSSFNLKSDDVVTILTTSGNFYISGCVTNEIEKFCKWSREIIPETKLLFVNHEFGYPYKNLSDLKELSLPIIEDCAGSFYSEDPFNNIGNIGDFVIYSFPKMFPLQIGGLLAFNKRSLRNSFKQMGSEELRYIKNVLSSYIFNKGNIINKRLNNYVSLMEKFGSIGCNDRFGLEHGIVPGVFMFRTDELQLDLPELKKHFYAHGVQCSIFYGEESFFIPVHQALNEHDIDYFFQVMKSFLKKNQYY